MSQSEAWLRGPADGVPPLLLAAQVALALEQLRATDEGSLLDGRCVGRAQRPSTVLGLLLHAAEHTQPRAGQIATTVRMVRS